MVRKLAAGVLCAINLVAAVGCGSDSDSDEGDFTSADAARLTFEFDAELVTDFAWNQKQVAQDQLLYTIGHLNGSRAVGRLDTMVLSNFESTRLDDGSTRITYHVVLPVAWGSKTNLPTSYEF